MKILAIADLHDNYETNEFAILQQGDYDICLTLGDINAQCLSWIKQLCHSPLYGIKGENDVNSELKEAGIFSLNGKYVTVDGITIAGIQGCYKTRYGNYPSFHQAESVDFVGQLPDADILICHDSPYHMYSKEGDKQGLKGITSYIKKSKPALCLHGHYHVNDEQMLKKTKVCGVYHFRIIEI